MVSWIPAVLWPFEVCLPAGSFRSVEVLGGERVLASTMRACECVTLFFILVMIAPVQFKLMYQLIRHGHPTSGSR
eukprot:7693362-Karenia_brevis.AAC.1